MNASDQTTILGISAFYHDSAAVLIRGGEIVAGVQEERFTRRRHDAAFPRNAIRYCLAEAGIGLGDVTRIVFYEKPLVKFERLLETYLSFAPRGGRSFVTAMPVWLKEKLHLKTLLRRELADLGGGSEKDVPALLFAEHHQSHAASAFYPSPFSSAAVLCLDGVGEWATTSAWVGEGSEIRPLWEIRFPHSLGLLYSAFTYYTGFRVNSGEYKVMGLAPYGEPRYVDLILDELMDLKPDGTFRLNMEYFDYPVGLAMTNKRFHDLFGGPPRLPESTLTGREMDLARSVQEVTEEVMVRLARTLRKETQKEFLCLAGGVALNCVGNGRILREGIFRDLWIQPASGDAGAALGAALVAWHRYEQADRRAAPGNKDAMKGSLLGPGMGEQEILTSLDALGARYRRLDDTALFREVAGLLGEEKVVGWFQGRSEFGPRALGCRSILGDPRSPGMQSTMNLKIKFRESFRPFAPAVLEEHVAEYFDLDRPSPYMLLVAPVHESRRIPASGEGNSSGIDRLKVRRSVIPAVTHVDYSARVQTVDRETNPRFYGLLRAFHEKTGCPVLVNTSFNVRGEPIVCSPADAYRCFMRTGMDFLVIGNLLLAKKDQPAWDEDRGSREEDAAQRQGVRKHGSLGDGAPGELRRFGITMAVALPVLLGLTLPWLFDRHFPTWPWGLGGLFGLLGLAAPRSLAFPYRAWMGFGRGMNWVSTRLLLGFVLYFLITPMGLVMRFLNRNPLARGFEPALESYRLVRDEAPDPVTMERMF